MRFRWLWMLLIVGGLVWPALAPADARLTRSEAMRMFAEATERSHQFSEGTGDHILYVYFDPNCIYCHLLYERIRPYIRTGRVRVAWIPVGFLKSDSPGKAEAILSASNPAMALSLNEREFNTSDEEGGIRPLRHPAAAVVHAVYDNTRLLEVLGEVATPTLVFADRQGTIHIVPGMPRHLGPVIDMLGPLPPLS
ncbi:MAG: thioredoxin fold domain-containing protein [Acidiferrobacteraceae bacterium]